MSCRAASCEYSLPYIYALTHITPYPVILAKHPNISFSVKKELHFFDSLGQYQKGVRSYLKAFPPHVLDSAKGATSNVKFQKQQLVSEKYASNPHPRRFNEISIGVESTPYYMASLSACRLISQHIPNVRLIFLLRDPVARAYSEYNMKKR